MIHLIFKVTQQQVELNGSIFDQENFACGHGAPGSDVDHIPADARHPGKPLEQLFKFAAHAARAEHGQIATE